MRNCNTVRKRATHFIESIIQNGIKELPLPKAKDLFNQITDLWDRTTIKAYFGTHKHVSRQNIKRVARYGTGTYSFKSIELIRDVETEKGYLEKLGLVHYELRGKTWFMIVNTDANLVPQLYERKQLPIENISLSPNGQNEPVSKGERARENRFEKGVSVNNLLETNNNLQDEREKSVDTNVFNRSKVELSKEAEEAS